MVGPRDTYNLLHETYVGFSLFIITFSCRRRTNNYVPQNSIR